MFKFTILLSLLIILYISTIYGATISVRQVNEDGFGDPDNNYAFAMEEFDGKLYVSTNNVVTAEGMAAFFLGLPFETNGTQIWRGDRSSNGDWTWENVLREGLLNPLNFGVRKLQTVGNYLYAVTSNHVTGFEIWRTNDGTTWTVEVSGGFGDTDNKSGRGLFIFDGYIYVGVENRVSGGKIYRREINELTGDYAPNSNWTKIVDNGNGNPLNWWFSDFVEFEVGGTKYLYVGTLNVLGFNVLRSSDGVTFNAVVVAGNGAIGNSAAMDLVVYNNKMYVGTMNFFVGTSLFVTSDGVTFDTVYTIGNGDSRNAYTWWMQEYNGRLYVATFNTGDILDPAIPGEFDIFSKVDPSDPNEPWIFETTNGFGNPFQYGIRSMENFDGKLIIGTATAQVEGALKIYEASPANSSFVYVNTPLSYQEARQYCKDTYDTDLASVVTDKEREEVVELMNDNSDTKAWFGLFSKNKGRKWKFVDKEPCPNEDTVFKCIDYWLYQLNENTNTRPRCIGNTEEGDVCAYYDSVRDGADNNMTCTDELPFICSYGCVIIDDPPYTNDGILGLIQRLLTQEQIDSIKDKIGAILINYGIDVSQLF